MVSSPLAMARLKASRCAFDYRLIMLQDVDDAIVRELTEAYYGLAKKDIAKVNVKASCKCRSGSAYRLAPLRSRPWTREG